MSGPRRARAGVAVVAAVTTVALGVAVSACSALLGDTSYRCASDDDGACPQGMVCAVAAGTCVDESRSGDDGGSGDGTTVISFGDDDDDASADAADGAPFTDGGADARAAGDGGDGGDSASDSSTFGTPPVCDGVISAGEYGSAAENTNVVHATMGQPWYVTWDDTNLYVAVAGVALGDGVVVYLSALAAGSTPGFDNYDGVTIDPLPFPAQLVFYAKAGDAADEYSELRTFAAASTWSDATTGTPMICGTDTNTNAREIVLPWSTLGAGGRPGSFRFLAFATGSSDSGPFAQVPATNPAASTGSWTHGFAVSDSDPRGTAPFAAPY